MSCYNAILDKRVLPATPSVPPSTTWQAVSLQDMKDYLRVDFDDDSQLISSLIDAATRLLEATFNVGITQKQLQVALNNSCGGIMLPGAPVADDVVVKDRHGNELDTSKYCLTGLDVKYLEWPQCQYLVLTYTSGYAPEMVPEAFKTAIKQQVTWMYEHRGDEDATSKICPQASATMAPFSNVNPFFL
ncbi:hypothetical protein DCC81_24760 [Chitinophaga parva]|uniref:Phage gp6-like head-tail connector protein n=1 Tax=Chitinophaga parva TaxID=2169414 RepID=A0A2T7BBM8_9BACT|nr:head-tail connector protein [Chitinophaga parva]PUZ21802.1 hypothetical protein DCC81_24760 [Chitinophaga parva]